MSIERAPSSYEVEQAEKIAQWTGYPNKVYAQIIAQVGGAAARLDAWRLFFVPRFLDPLHAETAEIGIDRYGGDEGYWRASIEFPASIPEWRARKIIEGMMLGKLHEPYVFQRETLIDSRAWTQFPLSNFVHCDERAVPMVSVSIRKEWRVRLEDFAVGKRQDKKVKYQTLNFLHPRLRGKDHGWRNMREVAKCEIKGISPATRKEWLFNEIERQAPQWQFHIVERDAPRRILGGASRLHLLNEFDVAAEAAGESVRREAPEVVA